MYTPCAVCRVAPNAPCGGGVGVCVKSKYVKSKYVFCVCVPVCPVVEGGEPKSKIKTGHEATSDLPARAEDIAAEVILPAILWFPGFLEKQFKA